MVKELELSCRLQRSESVKVFRAFPESEISNIQYLGVEWNFHVNSFIRSRRFASTGNFGWEFGSRFWEVHPPTRFLVAFELKRIGFNFFAIQRGSEKDPKNLTSR